MKVGFYPDPAASPGLRGSTSVGLALGTCDGAALPAGAVDVIERHAFRVLWDSDAEARPITLDLPGAAATAAACRQEFADMTWSEIGGALPVPVILCRVMNRPRSQRPHRFSLGLAAGFDAVAALEKTLKEAIHTDFGRGDIVNTALAQGWPQAPRWTPEARILFWAAPDAPDFPARPGDPVALSRLAAGDLADAEAGRQRLTVWARGARGCVLFARARPDGGRGPDAVGRPGDQSRAARSAARGAARGRGGAASVFLTRRYYTSRCAGRAAVIPTRT